MIIDGANIFFILKTGRSSLDTGRVTRGLSDIVEESTLSSTLLEKSKISFKEKSVTLVPVSEILERCGISSESAITSVPLEESFKVCMYVSSIVILYNVPLGPRYIQFTSVSGNILKLHCLDLLV